MSGPLPPELLQAVLSLTGALVVSMIVMLVGQRSLRRLAQRHGARLDARYRRLVLEATVADDDEIGDLLDRVRALGDRERAHIGRTVFLMLRDVTGEAAERLRAVGAAAGPADFVAAAARHRRRVIRADAAEALGLLAPEGALELLLELSADRDREVRTVAIRALGAFHDPRAISRVIDALATGSGVPPTVAASALLQQGSAAGDRVRRALDDRDTGVRRGAARVAGLLQAPGSGDALARLVEDEHESVRLAAMRSLERLPVRHAVPALVRAALEGGTSGEAAARAVASMPPAWSAGGLAEIAAHAEPGVRRAAGLPRSEAAV